MIFAAGRCVLRSIIVSLCMLAGLLAGLAVATASASYSSSVLADSPRGYWRLGEAPGATVLADSSGNGNNGTYAGGVTLGVAGAIAGDADTAASFDGVNDSASIPSSASLSTTSIFTVEGWIKRSSTTKSHQLMVKGNAFQLVVMNAGSGNQVWLRKANVTTLARSNGGVPADNAYHHVAATMNGAGSSVKIYIDGVQDTVILSAPQTIPDTTFPIVFGTTASNEARYDEFAFYATPLTATRIQAHVAAGTTPANTPPDVSTSPGALQLDEGDPAEAIDPLVTVVDADSANLTGATVQITAGLQSADELLFTNAFGVTNGGYVPATGTLTLTGTTSVANYQLALRAVQYRHNGDNPSSPKTVAFGASDAAGPGTTATKPIAITAVNDAPTVTTTATALGYTAGSGAVAVDPGLLLTDPDSATIAGATVTIQAPNFNSAQDTLALPMTAGLMGTFSSATGVLTLTPTMGPLAIDTLRDALRTVTYANSSASPTPLSRTIAFQVDDGAAAKQSAATSRRARSRSPAPPTRIPSPTTRRSAGRTRRSATRPWSSTTRATARRRSPVRRRRSRATSSPATPTPTGPARSS